MRVLSRDRYSSSFWYSNTNTNSFQNKDRIRIRIRLPCLWRYSNTKYIFDYIFEYHIRIIFDLYSNINQLFSSYKMASNKNKNDYKIGYFILFISTVEISGLAESVSGKSLSLRRESFSSRIRNSFCSWATIRVNFFVNRVVQILF